eukprot:82672-Rhodomonas_salina.1
MAGVASNPADKLGTTAYPDGHDVSSYASNCVARVWRWMYCEVGELELSCVKCPRSALCETTEVCLLRGWRRKRHMQCHGTPSPVTGLDHVDPDPGVEAYAMTFMKTRTTFCTIAIFPTSKKGDLRQ